MNWPSFWLGWLAGVMTVGAVTVTLAAFAIRSAKHGDPRLMKLDPRQWPEQDEHDRAGVGA